jgi:putative transposase
MTITSGHHCAYDVHYHVVFPVKYRKALISKEISEAILEIARGIEERYDIKFEQIGTDGDHIHILCNFHPKISGGEFVRIFKSITARQLFKQFPKLKQDLWGGQFWTDGYYIGTVSERGNWAAVERYVKNQGKTTCKAEQLRLWH